MARRSKDKTKKELKAVAKADADAATSTKCYLTDELPAELRNHIYELVLINKKEDIKVNKMTFAQPPLLRTCRQIRAEASSVYYFSHIFHIELVDFSAKGLKAMRDQASGTGLRLKNKNLRIYLSSKENKWSNMQQWLKWRFEDSKFPAPLCKEDCGGYPCCVLSGGSRIVDELATAEMEWEKVVKILEIHKQGMERKKRLKWKWD